MPMGGTLSIWLLQHLITKVLSKIMKKFYIRWISEIVLLTTAIMFILMFDIQYTAGFIMQSIFMIVMVIVGVFVFKHEEDILAAYLEDRNKDDLPDIDKKEEKDKAASTVARIRRMLSLALISYDDLDSIFILVEWPEVQDYMDKEWFRAEAVLYQVFGEEQTGKDSAYLIPIERVLDID